MKLGYAVSENYARLLGYEPCLAFARSQTFPVWVDPVRGGTLRFASQGVLQVEQRRATQSNARRRL